MSWENLVEIAREIRREQQAERTRVPDVCPIDGSILDVRADGVRNCRMGDFTWPVGARILQRRTTE